MQIRDAFRHGGAGRVEVEIPDPSKRRSWPWFLVLAILTIAVYFRAFDAGYVGLDDATNITANPHVAPPSLGGLKALWSGTYFGQYVPLSYTLWAGEAWLAERVAADGSRTYDPRLFHVVNVLLHALCAVLVFAVLRRLVREDVPAFLGALLFAWHPLQVETVAWISETRGTLASAFALASIYEYLKFRGQPNSDALTSTMPGAWRHYVVSFVFYLLGLLAKPSAVSVPLILVSLDFLWYQFKLRRSLALFAPWLLPAVMIAWLTSSSQAESISGFVFVPPWWQRPFMACDAITFYVWKLCVPIGLTPDYHRLPQAVLANPWTYVVWIIPVSIVALLAWLPDRRVWLSAAAIFVAVALPVSGLLPRAAQSLTTVADHYVYLGMLGPAWALAWLLTKASFRSLWSEVALGLVALGLASMWQTGYWQNDRVLCGRMLDLKPRSVTALYLLYRVELSEQNLAAAEELLLRAVEIDPYKPILMWDGNSFLVELGRFYWETGRNEDAIRVLERAVGNKGDGILAQELLINVLLQEGMYARVVAEATPIVEARPDRSQIRGSLVIALDKLGRHFEVIEPLQQLLREEPENAGLHAMLGKAYVATGNLPAARDEFEIVLELAPGDPVATDVLQQIEAQSHRDPSVR